MIARITRASLGLSNYLKDGTRSDSEYRRDQKDNVIPLYGDLDTFQKTEEFLNEHKNYSSNYMHITLSFNKEDLQRIEEAGIDKNTAYKDMIETYIKHHTSGYDLENEVIAYAEAHVPKIKEEHDRERLEHIHIAIALYNPLDDTKLRTDFKQSNFLDDVLQEYTNKKYGLTNPREFSREREGVNANTQTARDRKFYIEDLKDIGSKDELIAHFKFNNINYREVETAKNHYFKIITPGDQNDINLRGKGFEHISDIAQGKEIAANASRRLEELKKILTDHYQKRIDLIHNRRSSVSKKGIENLYKEEHADKSMNAIYPSYKQKLFAKHYGQMTDNKFTGYRIDLNAAEGVTFTNDKKDIQVVDRGDKITGGQTKNVNEQAKLMLDIAEAKGWEINKLQIQGSTAFKKAMHRQIAERIKEREELIQSPNAIDISRPTSEAEKLAATLSDEKKVEKLSGTVDLATIKTDLNAAAVLQYAADKYKLNTANYEITADNKINNITNKQKPKNVIDFVQKELNLSGKEAIEICHDLHKQQRETPNLQTAPISAKTKPNLGVQNVTRSQRSVALREPDTQSNRRQKNNTADNLPVLSTSQLVSDIKHIELLLQNYDDADIQRRSEDTNNRVRYTTARNDPATGRSSKIDGDIDMPLQISICKDTNQNALNKWEVVEVGSYTELATLMKQYPYSAAQFEKGYRNAVNATGSSNVLIYDIDNDAGQPQLSIAEATKMLEAKGVSAMILPSKSHNKDKNGHVTERFRIVVPTSESLPAGIKKEEYREFQKLTAKALDLDRFVDTKALNDKARFYYKSPVAAVPHIIKANSVMKIDHLLQQTQVNLQARRAEAAAEQKRIAQIRHDIDKHRQVSGAVASNYLTHADVDKIMSIPIADLIKRFEKAEEYREGDYHMLKTDSAKYSIVENNVAHDFKNELTYNNVTFLQKHYKTQNLNAIAKELKKETGESYIETNKEAVRLALLQAMRDAVNDRALEELVKEQFNVKYCKFDAQRETITIADREIKLSEIGESREQIVQKLRENRKEEEERQQRKSLSPRLK